ncbi:PGF-CTERM sorting domain-containing protein [Halogeometricum sp. S1BR25-6]|uniref:PGF-CTERM sorting domain-containing protein n=1 Tax=Halogeometricum salsisoli TaxID=2950536 RepID=A0ABU2GJE0_9EURY|nr:BGTF surface domain-containing protein [Halogeometricum sp. S1BR25-6]MDS0300403.1 PGF-CTERM sorting domain-containing protein [Halogeometricum sp. S1BR25-6]
MSETNNLRALLMAALVVMSVFAGVGTVSALDTGSASADPVAVGQDTATQDVTFSTTLDADETETITISGIPSAVDVLGVGASFENENGSFAVTDTNIDNGEVTVDITNEGNATETGNVTLALVHDTSDLGLDLIGDSVNFTVSNEAGENTTVPVALEANAAGDNDVIFQGQTVQVDVSGLNDSLTLREVDERDGGEISQSSFVEQLSAENGYVEIDTDDLEGDYVVSDGTGVNGANAVEFEVAVQSLTANWSEDSVTQGDSEDLELESGRSDYIVEVSADGLDADDLETIFGDSDAFVGTNDEDDSVYLDAGEQDEIPADFGDDIDAGDYEFDVEVTDTTASDSASIAVEESDADVNFADSVYTEQVGDVVEMSVNMEDRDEAYVYVGGDDVNYLEVVKLTDDDDDGMVNFTFNTYTANESNVNPFELVEDSDDELELATGDVETEDNGLPGAVDGTLSERLETGDYDLRTSTSLDYNVEDDEVEDEQDVATLDLGERNTSGIATWTAASGNADEFDDAQELLENVNESNVVAIGDRLVVQVNASGTSGVIDEDNVDSLLNGDEGMQFTVEEADAGANADSSELDLDSSNTAIYQNESSDQFFVVVDTRNVDVDDDTEYDATFTVGDEDADTSPIDYVDDEEEESVSTTFTAEEPDATLDLNDDDQFEVAQSQNAQVEFDTNLAGGSEVVVRLRSSASNSAFLLSNTVETDGNGTVMTTFDTSDVEVGTEFDMVVRSGSDEIASEDGIIVEGQNMTGTGTGEGTMSETPGTGTEMTGTEMSETPTETPGETTSEGSATPSEGTTTGSTDGGTPGFGVVVAVTALLAAALLAVRRD